MNIVLFGNAPEKNAAIRYRVLAFARMLEADGHRCTVCLPSSVALRERLFENKPRWSKLFYFLLVAFHRLLQLRHVPGADVVLFRGPAFDYGPPLYERIVHALCPRMVFDIDDAVWEPPAHVDSPFLRFVDFGWARKMCALCRHAIVGNAYLEAYVRHYLQAVTIVPTCIDIEKHTPKEYPVEPPAEILLGWTGLHDNLGYLELVEEPLRALARKHPLRLLIASGRPYRLEGVEVENLCWQMDQEIFYLQRPDIGLMPLKDTPRARGKCAFKALQYMAVGTPVVLSPVGMNRDVVEDGVTGFLADTPLEWREKLDRLIADPGLRRRMGEAARKTILERYTHAVNYPAFKAALEAAARQ